MGGGPGQICLPDGPPGPSSVLPLRDYQRAALDAVLAAYARGVRRQLLSLPTGSGKTVVATHLIRELSPSSTVFLVHRDELVRQAVRAIGQVNPNLTVGVVKASQNQLQADVVVASAQTLAQPRRRAALAGALGRPGLLVADECHHAVARTWRETLEQLEPELLLGLTATAYRADRLALGQLFDEVVFHLPMLPLVLSGRLANLIGLRIDTETSLDGVGVVAGEFREGELSRAVDTPARNGLIVDCWHEHAWSQGRRRAVGFCVDTAHAEHLRAEFRARGVPAEMVLGSTPTHEREAIFEQFHRGLLPVLLSVMVLAEGWDEPLADCGLMCRPTQSLGLYVQLAGRLARAAPGKDNALIIDFVDNSSRHSLVGMPTLAGLEAGAGEAPEADRRRPGVRASLSELVAEIGRVRKLRAVEVDLFGGSPYLWQQSADRWMAADGAGGYLTLWPEGDGYVPARVRRPRGGRPSLERLFDRPVDAPTARALAEMQVPKTPLTQREAAWRAGRPSEKQLALARALRIAVAPRMTRGELSAAIDRKMFEQTLCRLGELP